VTFVLRQYQQEAVDAGAEFLLKGKKRGGVIVLPTGSGKSLVISNIVARLDAPALVFQPSKEILEQNLQKFHAYGIRPSVYSASMNRKSVGEITLATIGSVAGAKNRVSKAHLFRDFPYIIPDEADLCNAKNGQYKDFFNEVDATLLGLTATPYRLRHDMNGSMLRFITRSRPRIFSELVYYVQNKDLFEEGYLAKLEYHSIKGFDRHSLVSNSTGNDYTDRSVQLHFEQIGFRDKLVKVVTRLSEIRRNVLVFTRFVAESQYLASQVPNCAVVTAETPKAEREAILNDFKRGRIKVVSNVGIIAIGFDYPELETVVLARPTMSLRVYYQQCGRPIRPHPNKESAWIVDMVGLVDQFGKIEDLELVDGGNGKWFIRSGDRPLTDCYLNEDGRSRCGVCGATIAFWMRHEVTGNRAPLSYPKFGIKPNIVIKQVGGKSVYGVVEPGDGKLVVHYAVCQKR
jgi:DNA repair protein RadD